MPPASVSSKYTRTGNRNTGSGRAGMAMARHAAAICRGFGAALGEDSLVHRPPDRMARFGARQHEGRIGRARAPELALALRRALARAGDERQVLVSGSAVARRREAGRERCIELRLGLRILGVVVRPPA